MAIRVVHVATGNAGRIALRQVIEDPRFELVGLVVSNDEKVGKDAGELAGSDVVTGIIAGNDLAAALEAKPECVVYCALAETRFFESLEDLKTCLASGANVVATSPVTMMYPWGLLPDSMIDPYEELCREHGVSLFVSGVDPGWANDLLPFAIASTCQSVEKITCYELADYATYDGAPVMFDVMGFGREVGDLPMLFKPGVLSSAWGVTLRQLAKGFGLELDEITEWFEQEPAPEEFDVAVGTIPKGGVAAVRFKIAGIVNGKEVLLVDHTTRLRPDLRPDWPQSAQEGGSYRVEIVGEPSYVVDVCPTSKIGDHNYAAIASGAGRVVNAIPDVVAAAPGIRTVLDLPLNTAKGIFATTLG
ncbi:diacylglycerol kinase [Nocardioides humilatus]|uniref:Diacylglycerol kinase n=1 Tax=Nocardioides humilatus TaxID=2607660 RepID=A0A5B1LN88_9ACTN|nr:diacylglycerol kinase [Nocardioides humilatus]KAA1421230.1 diacylglycerol kinase [Nocardioides humilatus]